MERQIPVKIVGDQAWLLLGKRGVFRAAKIEKKKAPVPDWDGHHCDEAVAKGSVRFTTRSWEL